MLGQSVLVDNRAGSEGAVGTDIESKPQLDGYRMCLCTIGLLVTTQLIYMP